MAAAQNFISVTRRPPDIEDYIDMLRRYRSWLIGPMFCGLVVAVVVAFLWPDTYVSSAVMRITPQQISDRLVPTIVNMQMQQRLDQMRQGILSISSLTELIATLAPGEHSALWSVLIGFIAQDTKRHLDLLEFMRTQML